MTQAGEDRSLRIAELLVPLSLVTDLGMGAPDEHAAGACVLATGLGDHLGLSGRELSDVYYTTLLLHLGCTATASEEASHLGGDEIATRPLVSRTDFTRPMEFLSLLTSIGAGRSVFARGGIVLGAIGGIRWGARVEQAVCEVAGLLAERLSMSEAVRTSLRQSFERWDGRGHPHGLAGDEIALPVRVAHVAARAMAFHGFAGPHVALAHVRSSAGGWFDPAVADAFAACGPGLLAELAASDTLTLALDCEPHPRRTVRADSIENVARVFADMADLKSVYTLGHSPAVGRLVRDAAAGLGLNERATSELQLAALLHDIGRVGVPAGVWEKRAPLSTADRERIRLHPYYSERILARTPLSGVALSGVASIAGLHHERLDGSGYHRGSRAPELDAQARLLAVADMFQAKTQERPHRAALPPEAAAELIAGEARAGRLDPDAVAAVVDAAGGYATAVAPAAPAGLTPREIEVLRLIAEGCSNRQIAERLVISRRTAEHHVQHVYEKIGLSTRASATIFALQHDLLSPIKKR